MKNLSKLRIGSRGSQLALWQANYVSELIRSYNPHIDLEIIKIKTSGDKIQDRALMEIGGKGLFVKEVQEALLKGTIDIAVHSMKDYPAENPSSLSIICVPKRENPCDALILPEKGKVSDLKKDAKIGSGSLRRKFQIIKNNPEWRIIEMRGNVDTRLKKLDSGNVDAIILAVAGIKRLGFSNRISKIFDIYEIVPAIGQGAICIEGLSGRRDVLKAVQILKDEKSTVAVLSERRFLSLIGGSCTTPLGVHGYFESGRFKMVAFLSSIDGERFITDSIEGDVKDSLTLSEQLYLKFEKKGAKKLIGITND